MINEMMLSGFLLLFIIVTNLVSERFGYETFSFVIYGVVPAIVGWFGIVASILYGFSNGIILVKP